MSRLTSITILALVTLLTIGAAVALGQAVTPDGTTGGNGGDPANEAWTCPSGAWGDEGAMKEHHESIHGEGSWENMPGPGATTEEMRQHHESIHGEGSWGGGRASQGGGETGAYGPMMGDGSGQTSGTTGRGTTGPMMGGGW